MSEQVASIDKGTRVMLFGFFLQQWAGAFWAFHTFGDGSDGYKTAAVLFAVAGTLCILGPMLQVVGILDVEEYEGIEGETYAMRIERLKHERKTDK